MYNSSSEIPLKIILKMTEVYFSEEQIQCVQCIIPLSMNRVLTKLTLNGSRDYIFHLCRVANMKYPYNMIILLLRFAEFNHFRVYLALIELSKTEFDEREYNDAVSRLQA